MAFRSSPVKRPFPWFSILLAIVFHFLVIILLHYERSHSSIIRNDNVPPEKPIQSYLVDASYFEKENGLDVPQIEEIKQEQAKPEQQVVAESLPDISKPQSEPVELNTEPSPTSLIQQSESAPKLDAQATVKTYDRFSNMHNTTSQYLENLNRNALSEMSQEGAIKHQSSKGTVKLPELKYEPEKYGIGRPRPTRVNCDSTLNKSIAILGGIMGGKLTCSEKEKYQKYIDARLKKSP